jgi:nicotinamidase-related amidase
MNEKLIDADDSVLIAIDIQDYFLKKLPFEVSDRLLKRVCWLIKVGHWRKIPLIVTAEELDKHPVAPKLLQSVPSDTNIFDKRIFGLAFQSDIMDAVKQIQRRTTVLIGLETDVCVAHSALGLLQAGYRVAVVADATGSPENGHEIGLNRMRDAGAIVVSTKSLFYEWLHDLEWNQRFQKECPELNNVDGIHL